MTDSTDAKPTDDATKTAEVHAVDELVITKHTLTTAEGELAYTARAGRVVLWQEKVEDDIFRGRKPRAQVAITAYTADDADPTTRPVTFAFNANDIFQLRAFRLDLRDHIEEFRRYKQRRCTAIIDRVDKLRRSETVIDTGHRAAHFHSAPEDHVEIIRVLTEITDPLARLHTKFQQGIRNFV